MAKVKDSAQTVSDLLNIPVDLILPNPKNVRIQTPEMVEEDDELFRKIMVNGYDRSRILTVRAITPDDDYPQDGRKYVVALDGNRRLKAVQRANAEDKGIQTLPCAPEPKGTSDSDRNMRHMTANEGLRHTPLEYSVLIKQQIACGGEFDTVPGIASRLGKTVPWVERMLAIGAMPAEIQNLVKEGVTKATTALNAVKEHGPSGARDVIRRGQEAAATRGSAIVRPRDLKPAQTATEPSQSVYILAEALVLAWRTHGDSPEHTAAHEACRVKLRMPVMEDAG